MTDPPIQVLLLLSILSVFLLVFIFLARRGVPVRLRRIAGLESIDEAVGRATELGRPVLFTTGLEPLNSVTTLAAIAALTRVCRVCAKYETRLIVTLAEADVYTLVKDACQQIYAEEGKPELYREEDIHFLSTMQFSYASGTAGIMQREQVGAAFFFGAFAAESLILSEAGNQIGAIQVAATTSSYQIPFFVASCDYTLIGEELFAASAYLTRDPAQLGSLVGQDLAKFAILLLVTAGSALATLAAVLGPESHWVKAVLAGLLGGAAS